MNNPPPLRSRPSIDDYLMGIAIAVRARANCSGQRVGSVIAQDGRIISTGYNGTPRDMTNCEDGGCLRCSRREDFVSGTGYDLCICVHAEQNALLAAARFGISVDGAAFYTTTRPCFGCTKEMLQAGIARVYFVHDWLYPDERMRAEYERLQTKIPGGIRQLRLRDDAAHWATAGRVATLPQTGHDGQ